MGLPALDRKLFLVQMIQSHVSFNSARDPSLPSFNPGAEENGHIAIGPSSRPELGLDEVACGMMVEVRRIVEQAGSGRLAELGFKVGRRVQVARGGDPLICQLDGARIGLGRGLARCIRVEIISGTNRWTHGVG